MPKGQMPEVSEHDGERLNHEETRSPLADGEESAAIEQADAALHGVRAAIDRASNTLRGLGRTGGQWAKDAEERAAEIGKGLRGQGERAVGEVTRQVETYPLASLAIAFALGFVCAAAITRR